ncbi:MAG: hypothetical protein QME94_10380, partial [Anaerolineae bacterium]|nr:hypothetical protein [Anaerolineae bacterium]
PSEERTAARARSARARQLAALEEEIAALEARLRELEAKISEASLRQDAEQVRTLSLEYAARDSDLQQRLGAWAATQEEDGQQPAAGC